MSKTTLEMFEICKSWGEAVEKSKGYEDAKLISILSNNFATNSPWINKPSVNLNSRLVELLAAFLFSLRGFTSKKCLMRAANEVTVADIGGGNGYVAYYVSKFFPEKNWVWNVYESSAVAEAYSSIEGIELPLNLKLNFINSDALFDRDVKVAEIDLILISCALQYLERPYKVLSEIFKINAPKVIMRIPFVDVEYDIPVVQYFEKLGGYMGANNASWPMWWFSRKKFLEFIAANETINYQWVTDSESYRFMSRDIPLEGLVCGCR